MDNISKLLLAFVLLCSSAVLLLVSSSQKALAQGNTFIVAMQGSSQQPGFAPDLLTVHIYDTVVFVNSSATPIAITTTDSSFSSPAIAPGKQWNVTFNSTGAFEYHDSNPTPRTFGVIVVVPDTVALLPASAPAAQQTAIAYIQSGKTPPDTVWQQATPSAQKPVAVSLSQNQTARSLSVPPLALLLSFARPVILVVTVLFALCTAGLAGLWLYGRLQSRTREDEDEDDEDDE
jgi:plastocyanin